MEENNKITNEKDVVTQKQPIFLQQIILNSNSQFPSHEENNDLNQVIKAKLNSSLKLQNKLLSNSLFQGILLK